jgi:diguanylate cyclase (GGDEF)-like protein
MINSNPDYNSEHVLIVDDNPDLRESLEALLGALGFEADTASDGHEAIEKLKSSEFSFLLTDMKMPEMDGLELIALVNHEHPHICIIAMTGYSEGYRYVDVINAGASDFLKKPFDIEEFEAKARRVIHERNLREELSRLSVTDSLTGLYNQRYFYQRLHDEITRANRQGHSLSLILLDLNYFKDYNDTHGHLAGDEVLRMTGQIINKCIREGVDSGYRYGGDEFAIILIDADLSVAKEIGKRIENAFEENGKITASLGYGIFNEHMSVKDLVADADQSLYDAKKIFKGQA